MGVHGSQRAGRPASSTYDGDQPAEAGAAVVMARSGVGSAGGSVVTLRAPSRLAAQIAFSSDNGKLWIALRPAAGAPGVKGNIVTLSEVLGSSGYLIVKQQQSPQQNSNDQGTSK